MGSAAAGGATLVIVLQRAHRTFNAPAGYSSTVPQPEHTICAEGAAATGAQSKGVTRVGALPGVAPASGTGVVDPQGMRRRSAAP